MRNQIGIPPLEREVDAGPVPPPTLGTTAPRVTRRRHHAGMDGGVEEAARHDDLPDVGGYDRPITERDTNVGLYVGITIGVFAIIIAAMVVAAFF
ncbi:MAG: hypothetical protein WBD40_14600 [Tepidisphaeraceae bacterium]